MTWIARQWAKAGLAAAIVASGALSSAGAAVAQSSQPPTLEGAWVADGKECSDVFTAVRGKPTFKKGQGDELPGFIVKGRNVRGLEDACRVSSSREKDETRTFSMTCTSSIDVESRKASVKFLDSDTISRFDPSFPEAAVSFKRCRL
jgi:hypothetical protein